MRVSAKADYAVRAAIELAANADAEHPLKGESIGEAQGIPLPFLQNILAELRHAGIVNSKRGADGGHWLTRPADDITIAEVIRAVEGPLASVRGETPEELAYRGEAEPLQAVWLPPPPHPRPGRPGGGPPPPLRRGAAPPPPPAI